MIEHPDVHQRQRLAQPAGDELVRLAGLGNARGVVVSEDHRCGIAAERLLDDFARMHAGAVDGAAKQLVEGDQAVAVVQVQAAEQLMGLVPQPADQEAVRSGRRIQQRSVAQGLGVVTPRQFQGGLQTAIARRAQAPLGEQGGAVGYQEFPQRAVGREQAAGEIDDVAAAEPGTAEQQGHHLGVRQGPDAQGHQLLARPLLPVILNGHGRGVRWSYRPGMARNGSSGR